MCSNKRALTKIFPSTSSLKEYKWLTQFCYKHGFEHTYLKCSSYALGGSPLVYKYSWLALHTESTSERSHRNLRFHSSSFTMERHRQLTNGHVSEKQHHLLLKVSRNSPDFCQHLMNNIHQDKSGNWISYGLIQRAWDHNWKHRETPEL